MVKSSRNRRWLESDFREKKPIKKIRQVNLSAKDYVNGQLLETDIQQSLITELTLCGKKYKGLPIIDFIYAVPNGGYRAKSTAKTMKAEGVRKGIPDLHCFIAVAPYHSLYIEMKREDGDVSEDQKRVIPIIRGEGHKVVVCRSAVQARNELFKYLGWNAT